MRVCVIGAGVSGLVSCKALRDHGIDYSCFEASDDVGGNWYFRNPNGRSSAYRSLHIDTSKERISFADFPMPAHYPDFPHHSELHAWLRDYADHFGLRESIRFNTAVERAERLDGGSWDVDGERFDALVVCNGHHWDPRYPDFPGHFDGPAIHSHDYIDTRDPIDMHDKRVLVVGIGNSAVDILYATGYNISFPFFDPEFLSAPENELPLYKRMFKPGLDDLVFVGLGQAIPTIFPFAELQAKLMGRYFAGEYALPAPAEMQRTIAADEAKHRKHFSNRPRHTMQLDWYVYEHDMTRREIPAGEARARARRAPATPAYAAAGANP